MSIWDLISISIDDLDILVPDVSMQNIDLKLGTK
jgi:hypothetical protein